MRTLESLFIAVAKTYKVQQINKLHEFFIWYFDLSKYIKQRIRSFTVNNLG